MLSIIGIVAVVVVTTHIVNNLITNKTVIQPIKARLAELEAKTKHL